MDGWILIELLILPFLVFLATNGFGLRINDPRPLVTALLLILVFGSLFSGALTALSDYGNQFPKELHINGSNVHFQGADHESVSIELANCEWGRATAVHDAAGEFYPSTAAIIIYMPLGEDLNECFAIPLDVAESQGLIDHLQKHAAGEIEFLQTPLQVRFPKETIRPMTLGIAGGLCMGSSVNAVVKSFLGHSFMPISIYIASVGFWIALTAELFKETKNEALEESFLGGRMSVVFVFGALLDIQREDLSLLASLAVIAIFLALAFICSKMIISLKKLWWTEG